METSDAISSYISAVRSAAGTKLYNGHPLYSGRDGHIRFAHEVGAALPDFSEEDRKEFLMVSYGSLYVRACNLRPLLDAGEWHKYLLEGEASWNKSTEEQTGSRGRAYRRAAERKSKTHRKRIAESNRWQPAYYWAMRKVNGEYTELEYIKPVRHNSNNKTYWKRQSNKAVRSIGEEYPTGRAGYKRCFNYQGTLY